MFDEKCRWRVMGWKKERTSVSEGCGKSFKQNGKPVCGVFVKYLNAKGKLLQLIILSS